jgi:type I restriction enzyme M protein
MRLSDIFKNTTYGNALFSEAEVSAVENRIVTREVKGVTTPYTICLVRDKEIKLTPEEVVRQLYAYRLLNTFGYTTDRIKFEYEVTFGREKKRADIVIVDKDRPDTAYIIIEVKKPKQKDGKEQLKSYTNATGAPIAVWTNGQSIFVWNRRDPNYFEPIPHIPRATEELSDVISELYTYADLKARDKIANERTSLRDLILDMEDEVLANAGVDAFEEVFKLILAKLYDEMVAANDDSYYLRFRNSGERETKLKEKIEELFNAAKDKWDGIFSESTRIGLTSSLLSVCVSTLQDVKLFNNNLDVVDDAFEYLMSKTAKSEKGQYFTPRYVIDMCVRMMNPREGEDTIDTAAGSSGFTAHSIFKVWKDIRTSQGLSVGEGFTTDKRTTRETDFVRNHVFAIDYDEKPVRVARTLNLIAGDGQTNVLYLNTLDYGRWAETTKEQDWIDKYNDGFKHLRKRNANGVRSDDYSQFSFDLLMANPPFAGDIKEGSVLSKYELGKNAKGNMQSTVSRHVLFIERNLNFLKSGGRMAIVLPQGIFNNSTDKYIRDFIAERCRILAVVGLHGNVFKPHTGTKTSVLFVQKWDDTLCPKVDDYPIFFATMQKPSKDNSGDKIYVSKEYVEIFEGGGKKQYTRDEFCDIYGSPDNYDEYYSPELGFLDGYQYRQLSPEHRKNCNNLKKCRQYEELLLDAHGHLIVDHDLYNHDGLTADGIAEAFTQFAKRENLSFFVDARPFDAERYAALMSGLECNEVVYSVTQKNKDFRIDSQFYTMQLKRNAGLTYARIGDCLINSQYGISIAMNEDDDGYPIYRMNEIHNMLCDLSVDKCAAITEAEFEVFKLNSGDVLFNRTNSYEFVGRTGVYYPNGELTPMIYASYLVRFVPDVTKINSEYLAAFLNCKYGIKEIKRRARQSVNQTNVNPEEVKEIQIPLLGSSIQDSIQGQFHKAHQLRLKANATYTTAEQTLLTALGMQSFMPSSEPVAVKMFSESFGAGGRLDAEYYQKKYEDLLTKISKFNCAKLDDIVKIEKSIEPGSDYYSDVGIPFVRVSDITKFGIQTPDIRIPSDLTALRPKKDIILLSKDGSVGIAYKVEQALDVITSGALLHLTVVRNDVLPDYLTLVLNSQIVQMQAERDAGGSIIQHWKPKEIAEVVIPVLDIAQQRQIAADVKQTFALRRESERLLDCAKRTVEIAIEDGEDVAAAWLKEQYGEVER